MGFLSRFEGKMEDTVEGAAEMLGGSSLSPVQIAKKAEKQMRREKIVGAGKQYAPTLYTVLVSVEDDARMFNYYPTLAGETETYLMAKASELGYVMDGQPLVRFIADDELKRGKFDVVAEMVASGIITRLRNDEFARYGLAQPDQPVGVQPASASPRMGAHARGSMPQRGQGAHGAPAQSIAAAYAQRSAAAGAAGAASMAGGVQQNNLQPIIPPTDPKDGFRDLQEEFDPQYDQINSMNISEPELGGGIDADPYTYEVAPDQGEDFAGLGGVAPQAYGGEPFTAQPLIKGLQQNQDPYVGADQAADMQAAPLAQNEGMPLSSAGAGAPTMNYAAEPAVDIAGNRIPPEPLHEVYLYDEIRDRAYRLTGYTQSIGRESSNDIIVPDINASRVHATIHREPTGAWIISDSGSLNGLFVNGRKIKSAPLRDADIIRIGTTELEFQLLE